MLLKVVEGDGFKIYSGFEDIQYILKGMNRFRVRMANKEDEVTTDKDGRPFIVESRPGESRAPDEQAYGPVTSMFYVHTAPNFPREGHKPVHFAKLFFGDGTEKHIVFDCGFLCNESGETVEAIR